MRVKHTLKRAVAVTGIVAATGFAAVLTVPAVASADGTSGSVNGTYARWWSTAFAAYGSNVNVSGRYQLRADQNNQVDYTGPWVHLDSGFTGRFDRSEARHSVRSAWTVFGG
jgi:hypothetical protein